MCNLSQGVLQRGIEQGELKKAVEIAKNGLKNNISLDTISIMTGLTISELKNLTVEKHKHEIS